MFLNRVSSASATSSGRSSRFCCMRRQEKREGKERKGKVSQSHKTLYFSHLWGGHPWADSHKVWHACNCTYPIFEIKFSGDSDLQGSKSPFSYWLRLSSLQQCCCATLSCDLKISLDVVNVLALCRLLSVREADAMFDHLCPCVHKSLRAKMHWGTCPHLSGLHPGTQWRSDWVQKILNAGSLAKSGEML